MAAYSIRQTDVARYLPVITHQGASGVCAFVSVLQFLKFRVCRQFSLTPAEAALDAWWTPEQLMFTMLALEGNPYGLVYDPSSGDCATTPLTVLRYIRNVGIPIPVPQGILRITSIDTYRTLQNLNGIDGGDPGDQETEEIGSLDEMWEYITQIISEGEPVLGELTAVETQFLNHISQGVYVPSRRRGSRRMGDMLGHASMVTGHNYGVGGKRYLEIHNTFGSGWGGWNGYGREK